MLCYVLALLRQLETLCRIASLCIKSMKDSSLTGIGNRSDLFMTLLVCRSVLCKNSFAMSERLHNEAVPFGHCLRVGQLALLQDVHVGCARPLSWLYIDEVGAACFDPAGSDFYSRGFSSMKYVNSS